MSHRGTSEPLGAPVDRNILHFAPLRSALDGASRPGPPSVVGSGARNCPRLPEVAEVAGGQQRSAEVSGRPGSHHVNRAAV